MYQSDFGLIAVVPNRQMARAGATVARNAFLVDPKMVSLGVFDDIQLVKPAKTGDAEKRVLVTEYTLLVSNEAAHGVAADLYGLTADLGRNAHAHYSRSRYRRGCDLYGLAQNTGLRHYLPDLATCTITLPPQGRDVVQFLQGVGDPELGSIPGRYELLHRRHGVPRQRHRCRPIAGGGNSNSKRPSSRPI
jgi:hypothetical protein